MAHSNREFEATLGQGLFTEVWAELESDEGMMKHLRTNSSRRSCFWARRSKRRRGPQNLEGEFSLKRWERRGQPVKLRP